MAFEDLKIIDGHFYIKKTLRACTSQKEYKKYKVFKIYNSKKDLIDCYDFLNLENVRLDVEKNLIRIYPKLGYNKICYDTFRRIMYSIKC